MKIYFLTERFRDSVPYFLHDLHEISETIHNNYYYNKQLRHPETVEVGCPRHPGATIIGNQLQDGDRTDGWPNLTTQP